VPAVGRKWWLFVEHCLPTYIDVHIFPFFGVGNLTPKTCLSILEILRMTKYHMIYKVHRVVKSMRELVCDQGISIKWNCRRVSCLKTFIWKIEWMRKHKYTCYKKICEDEEVTEV